VDPVALAERRLAWADRRQRVLAQNIANADTPAYRPRDITPFARMIAEAEGPPMARTQPAHLAPRHAGPPGSGAEAARTRIDRQIGELSPNGNGVALDEQALRVADTDTAHALAMGLHRKLTGLVRLALGRNG
jgi:flagellar basal-body rod protein FlgB